jgi:hypothetical protein
VIGEQNVKKFEAENFSHLHSFHYLLTRIVRQRRTPRIIHVELSHSDQIFIHTKYDVDPEVLHRTQSAEQHQTTANSINHRLETIQ